MSPKCISLTISKIDAAERQLNTAIRLLFSDSDPVAIHTLVGAASIVFGDLVESGDIGGSWEQFFADDNDLTLPKFLRIARKAQNFFKHAATDPAAELEFDLRDTEVLLFIASLNWGTLIRGESGISEEMSVFQLWFIATWHPEWAENENTMQIGRVARNLFPDITSAERSEQLSMGLGALESRTEELAT